MHSFQQISVQPTKDYSHTDAISLNQFTLNANPNYRCYDDKNTICPKSFCMGTNPKLYDAARAMRLPLSRPHLELDLPVMYTHTIYEQPQQPSGHMKYKDIKYGQIQYYLQPSTATAFPEPVYQSKLPIHIYRHIDPMCQSRHEYRRFHPNEEFNAPTQHARDDLKFREDLMEHQSRRIENQRVAPMALFLGTDCIPKIPFP